VSRPVKDSRLAGLENVSAGRAGVFLLLVPLLPNVAAGGVEAEQNLELGVGLVGLAGPQQAPNEERPRREQLWVEPDRLAASRDGFWPIAGLVAGKSQRQVMLRAPGVDRNSRSECRLGELWSLEAGKKAA
jgi:hypothetical protein